MDLVKYVLLVKDGSVLKRRGVAGDG